MKLTAYCLAGTLIALDFLLPGGRLPIVGASIFLLIEVAQLFRDHQESKAYRNGTWKPKEKTERDTATEWVRGIVLYGGIVAALVQGVGEAAAILWFGIVGCGVITGLIAQVVGRVPMRMTYGGWKVDRGGRGRRR